jgi:hypothetical protein
LEPLLDEAGFKVFMWVLLSVLVIIPGLIIHLGISLKLGYFWGKHRQTKYTREEWPNVFWFSVVAEVLLICLLSFAVVRIILDAYANG